MNNPDFSKQLYIGEEKVDYIKNMPQMALVKIKYADTGLEKIVSRSLLSNKPIHEKSISIATLMSSGYEQ